MSESKISRKRNTDSKTSRRVRQEIDVDKKEQQLTSLIFGGNGLVDDSATSRRSLKGESKEIPCQVKGSSPFDDLAKETPPNEVALWQDPDDGTIQVSANSGHRLKKLRDSRQDTSWNSNELEARLRQRYEKTAVKASSTKWASVQPLGTESEKDTIHSQSESGKLFSAKGNRLPPNVIDIIRLKDANADDPCSAVLRCAQFYQNSDPDEPMLMTAGLDRCLRFYQINKEDEAKKVHGIHCKFMSLKSIFVYCHSHPSYSSKTSDLQSIISS
jgi:hypothetical protein